jgi:hypothetical protein
VAIHFQLWHAGNRRNKAIFYLRLWSTQFAAE